MSHPLKILVVSSEVAPFAKTGGLADVAGSLPRALKESGHDVRVIMPFYKKLFADNKVEDELVAENVKDTKAPVQAKVNSFNIRQSKLPGTEIPVYFVEQDHYYNRDELYAVAGKEYKDNAERFAFFSRAVLESAKELKFKPHVLHCNDWHTALIPTYLKTLFKDDEFYEKVGTLFTIHNLAFQGVFHKEEFAVTSLPDSLFNAEGLEFYSQVNFMKGALAHADKLTTVSKRYAEEIQTAEFGCGLEGMLSKRASDLEGIVNGVDYGEWSPQQDPFLKEHFDADSLEKKEKFKNVFLKEIGLEAKEGHALLGVVSRLDNMKGLNLIQEIMDYLMHMDVHFVLLGTGDPKFHQYFESIRGVYPEKISVNLTFSNEMAHKIEAASDIFLMPSRFEPCGLNQLISMKYGTVPVVRAVGGLADTIEEYSNRSGEGTGFTFHEYSSMALFNTIQRALEVYRNKEAWQQLQKNCMQQDFSWLASARKYVHIYREIQSQKKES